ncbi:MAG: PLP-dependent transferase [Cryomorphaceae bacterium]|nr:PLP-dependent transferase [Cryomorphaceae bacterium]MBT3503760.1 PLP-dependent transferase [Cryomorphaceae bacterium]MBT3688975.1 PLP-dependent transferase [Cryomorphaceae bacterium]MBT4221612.1 PLP-dependent transferase [Cryomorphaceae bacterium]MBT4293820.1 PLP-dependent transferase [Cryomorphaceae bacterium]
MKFNTRTIHGGQILDPAYGSVMTPIYQTSTYAQTSPGKHKGYEYSRTHNPTRTNFERSIASLENGNHGLAFASGLAAIDAIIKTLGPGDEIISTNDLYGGSYRLFKTIFEKYHLKFHFVNMEDIKSVEEKINSNTKLIWAETPTNPMMNVVDIKSMSTLAKNNNILLCVDNTFATPYIQRPLDLGADIVMHSATKYIAGHSDVVIGAVVVNDSILHEKLSFIQNASGATPGPMDCFLTLRGIKTLHLRMQRHSENAERIAMYLKDHKKISKVYWAGLKDHKNYKIAKSQMDAFGGMVSFIPVNDNFETSKKIAENLKLFTLAESLGGVESLCCHPASMTHASIPPEERKKSGLVESLLRLSVGVEDVDDLIDDLNQAIG